MAELERLLAPRLTKYIPHVPTPPQAAFLLLDVLEALFGGAAGGGKSDALLMSGLQYVDVPGYNAVIFRRTYPMLAAADGLIPRSHEWLAGSDARWSEKHTRWTFPSGATLAFRHLQYLKDIYDHQGAAYHFVGFDEATQFMPEQVRYLFSRARRPQDGAASQVPIRIRMSANPGGLSHEFIRDRYDLLAEVPRPPGGRVFIPSKLEDNPHLDRKSYERSLAELDPITQKQLRHGDWRVKHQGNVFKRHWFRIVDPDELPASVRDAAQLRYWDQAATETKPGKRPDATAGAKGALPVHADLPEGVFLLWDVRHFRAAPEEVERRTKQTAEEDGRRCMIWIEQEPGSSGKSTISHYQRNVLKGYVVEGDKVTGSKRERWKPLVAKAAPRAGEQHGRVWLVRGPWVTEFLDEVEAVTWEVNEAVHDDQVDAAAGCLARIEEGDLGWLRKLTRR